MKIESHDKKMPRNSGMRTPGVTAVQIWATVTGGGASGIWLDGGGANHCGVPGAGNPAGFT